MPLHLFPTEPPGEDFARDLHFLLELREDQYELIKTALLSTSDLDSALRQVLDADQTEATIESFKVLLFILSRWTVMAMDLDKLSQDLTTLNFTETEREKLIKHVSSLLTVVPSLHQRRQTLRELSVTERHYRGISAAFDLRAVYRTSQIGLPRDQDPLVGFEPIAFVKVSVGHEDKIETFVWQMSVEQLEALHAAIADFRLRALELVKRAPPIDLSTDKA